MTEWPTEPNSVWWLYARMWGDAEPHLYSTTVRKIANGVAYVTHGQFLFPNSRDIDGPALWTRAVLPELP